MDCPRCQAPMIILEHDRLEVDHCLSCGGIWFDGGELELLLEQDGRHWLQLGRPAEGVSEGRRRCPRCHKRMDKVFFGEGADLLLDRCRQGDGLWFDRGELQRAAAKIAPSGREGAIAHFLTGIFGPGAAR